MNMTEAVISTAADPGRFYLLVYDIPSRVKLPNPSGLLHRRGIRVNLSAWLVPERNVATLPIKEWREKGADVELARFDEGDQGTILRLARKGLHAQLDEIKKRLAEQVANAEREYQRAAGLMDTGPGGDRDLATKRADSKTYWALYRSKAGLAAAQEAALAFAILGDVNELMDGLRAAILSANDSLFAARQNFNRATAAQREVA